MGVYDGTTDSYNHLESFKVLIILQGASDALLSKPFRATLQGVDWVWYTRLQSNSIHSFEKFGRLFAAQFQSNKNPRRDIKTLFSI